MKSGLVSIITPTFNSEKYILETIQSVIKQTYSNWEMIIVDDCSTDSTFSLLTLQAELEPRIKVLKLAKNSGAGVARQLALDNSNGNYIAFLDSDDMWKPEKLQVQIDFLKTNNLAITFSGYELIDEKSNPLRKLILPKKQVTYKELFYCNWIGNLTGIYDVTKIGKIPISTFRKRQDWIMWLEVLKIEKVAFSTPNNLAYYRIRKDSISASKLQLLKSNYLVYYNYHKQNVVSSFFSMLVFLYNQLIVKKN
ncbi:glycosyltransferase [Flavobacterium agricola]|uniref:Glycosyltransferase n=1 Tax=Flavobacterium agricola TaxID=2870839 RepID=A0ABY6LZD1_9FLAO|nr:glycosyltransferase family 2 protein [Flavobacterium agricola]UYW00912.1 glycosyltransferase [Flavobacterium agricola]